LVLITTSALAVAGCSSDDDKGSDPTGSSSSPNSEVLGTPKAASGEAVSVGFIYDGITDAQDLSAELTGAKAAVSYINDYMGGIAGRPIKLDVCETAQTPGGAAKCVTQMASDNVVAVINPDSAVQGAMLPQAATEGIPVFVAASLDQDTLATPGISIMQNGLGYGIAGPAKLAAENGYKKAAIVVTDVPAAAGAVSAAAPGFYGNVGVEVDVVPIAPDAADMTPEIQAELSNDPSQFDIIGVPAFCARAIKAIKSAGFDGDIVALSTCADESTVKTVGDLSGLEVVTATSTDAASDEHQLYAAIMDKYQAGEPIDDLSANGYAATLGFGRALSKLSGEPSRETIAAALTGMDPTPMPLGDGITFQCDRKQVAIAPNICSTAVLAGTLEADGKVNSDGYSELDVSDVLKLPSS
jgi:branched-chain amino acid transport system substrate-binding protein